MIDKSQEPFVNGKLYGLFSVISNKTVRAKESFYKRFKGTKNVPGKMIKTNRGFFIDGYNVDQKSVDLWFEMNRQSKNKK